MEDKGYSGQVCNADSSGAVISGLGSLELSPGFNNHFGLPGREGVGRKFFLCLFIKFHSAKKSSFFMPSGIFWHGIL